jgi:hypothetical protein
MAWVGSGINYGTFDPHTPYLDATVYKDFRVFKHLGITKLRIAYNAATNASVSYQKALALKAKAAGFEVLFGVHAGNAPITATMWAAYKAALPALAQWAQTNGIDEFGAGNEEELRCDNTTLPVATVISESISTVPTIVRANYSGTIVHCTDQTNIAAYTTAGKGSNDKLGFNVYDNDINFKAYCAAIVSAFGSSGILSEWSTTGGFSSGYSEHYWAQRMVRRAQLISEAGITEAYCFAARDGGSFGVTANTYGLIKTDGGYREALASLGNKPLWYKAGSETL